MLQLEGDGVTLDALFNAFPNDIRASGHDRYLSKCDVRMSLWKSEAPAGPGRGRVKTRVECGALKKRLFRSLRIGL